MGLQSGIISAPETAARNLFHKSVWYIQSANFRVGPFYGMALFPAVECAWKHQGQLHTLSMSTYQRKHDMSGTAKSVDHLYMIKPCIGRLHRLQNTVFPTRSSSNGIVSMWPQGPAVVGCSIAILMAPTSPHFGTFPRHLGNMSKHSISSFPGSLRASLDNPSPNMAQPNSFSSSSSNPDASCKT